MAAETDDPRNADEETQTVIATVPAQVGEYQIIRRIGGGGMGVVYEALHLRLKRRVALKFSRDGKLLYSAGDFVRVWSLADATPLNKIGGHAGEIFSVDESPDGTLLASGGSDATIRVSQVPNDKITLQCTLQFGSFNRNPVIPDKVRLARTFRNALRVAINQRGLSAATKIERKKEF